MKLMKKKKLKNLKKKKLDFYKDKQMPLTNPWWSPSNMYLNLN